MRLLLVIALSSLIAACGDPAPGTPFAVRAEPGLRAAIATFCAYPSGSLVPTEDLTGPKHSVQSEGSCSVRLLYDAETLEIYYLHFNTSSTFDQVRTFVDTIAIPMMKPWAREYLETHVMVDLGASKRFTYSVRGKGEIRFRNDTYVRPDGRGYPGLLIAIGRR